LKPHNRITDRLNSALANVLHPADPIEHFFGVYIVKEPIDREVSAEGVFVSIAKDIVRPDQQIFIVVRRWRGIATKRGGFDHVPRWEQDVHEPEPATNDA
jgi:hypothetical protein